MTHPLNQHVGQFFIVTEWTMVHQRSKFTVTNLPWETLGFHLQPWVLRGSVLLKELLNCWRVLAAPNILYLDWGPRRAHFKSLITNRTHHQSQSNLRSLKIRRPHLFNGRKHSMCMSASVDWHQRSESLLTSPAIFLQLPYSCINGGFCLNLNLEPKISHNFERFYPRVSKMNRIFFILTGTQFTS